ncbi:MAG: hypothetical protein TRG1_2960 [Flavobacteriaceae bacterium FS1-H7996/R]|nr:MAG: hypothetical protein TRG1_2960 [Flavobacteriaceae bacterium FS1-H7996/R]
MLQSLFIHLERDFFVGFWWVLGSRFRVQGSGLVEKGKGKS